MGRRSQLVVWNLLKLFEPQILWLYRKARTWLS
jgi:hypothetical protein